MYIPINIVLTPLILPDFYLGDVNGLLAFCKKRVEQGIISAQLFYFGTYYPLSLGFSVSVSFTTSFDASSSILSLVIISLIFVFRMSDFGPKIA